MSERQGLGRPVVRFERNGCRLLVPRASARIKDIFENVLTYTYLGLQHGRGRRQVVPERRSCFAIVRDKDKVLPDQIMTAAGYYPRLREAFTRAGFAIRYSDNTHRPHPEAYNPLWDRLQPEGLRYRQEECIRAILSSEYGRIWCPTGYGKTTMIGRICQMLPRARIDVSTHSRDVIGMIYENLSDILPSVGLVHGSKKETGRRVMCYSGKSLHHSDGKADILIIDECHEWGSADYLKRIVRYRHSRNFGFSANGPGDRLDGADFELEGAFGPVITKVTYEEAVSNNCISQVTVMWVDVAMDVNPCGDSDQTTTRLRHGIWRNRIRNEKIASIATHFHQKNHQVLVVVDTVEHACFLKKLLPNFELVYGEGSLDDEERSRYIRWGLLTHDEPIMTMQRRQELKKVFESGQLRGAIATGVWNRGMNFRKLQVLVRADAKASPVADAQIPGRLSRLSESKPYGLLVDFSDQFDSTFKRRANDRRKQYSKMGWDQIRDDRKNADQARLFY